MAEDPYVYMGTNVLRNRLGIRDAGALEAVEADLTAYRATLLGGTPLPGDYDLAHLQAFHHRLFAGLYDWSGELRTIALAKSDLFCLPEHIDSYAAGIFESLAHANYLRGREQAQFVDGLAAALGDVNALHPFREGNGRTQRAFFSQLAEDAGYRLVWGRVGAAENVEASSAALRGDPGPLRRMLGGITCRA